MTTWNLSSLLQGRTTDELIKELQEKVTAFSSYKEKLSSITPEGLLQAIKDKEAIAVLASRIGAYYGLKLSENTHDQDVLAKDGQFGQLMSDLSNELLFFPLWFMHLSDEKAQAFLSASCLAEYKYYLSEIRKDKPYTKSEEIEKIISIKSVTGGSSTKGLYEIHTNGFKFDFNGKKGLTREEVMKHVQGTDPALREAAYKTVLGRYGEESTLLSEMYKNIVLDWNNEGVKIRGYKDAITIRNHANDIPDEAVTALLSVVEEHSSLFSEYFSLKYELNKAKGLEYPFSRYHLYAPYPAPEKEYGYEESKVLVLDTYKQFSEDFYVAAKKIFDVNHVHAFPVANKRGGAFCYSVHTKDIPFILLNHVGTVRDLFTMMHEFGHGIHGMLSRKQNEMNYDTALPMAETASIFGEMVLADRLLSESNNTEEKKSILIHLLDNEYASIGRQAFFVLFEKKAHEMILNGATKEELDKEWIGLLEKQFGSMTVGDEFKHEWNYIPHIHATPFYCYAYSWGNLLVLSLFDMYRKEGDSFKEKYSELLSAGGNASPAELLRGFGVDPSEKNFWRGGFKIIKEQIEELKKLG